MFWLEPESAPGPRTSSKFDPKKTCIKTHIRPRVYISTFGIAIFEKSSKINYKAEWRDFFCTGRPPAPLRPLQISGDLSQPVSCLERKSRNDQFLLQRALSPHQKNVNIII